MPTRKASVSRGRRASGEQLDEETNVHQAQKSSQACKQSRQPKIDESLSQVSVSEDDSEESVTAPATTADIHRVLEKLDLLTTDNETIKTQLKGIQDSFTQRIESLDSRISKVAGEVKEEIRGNKEGLRSLETKMTELEASMNFQGEQLELQKKEASTMLRKHKDLLAKIKEAEGREDVLKREITSLREKNLDMERHVRKYNLLFYGIPERADEDIEQTVRSFLKSDARIPGDRVEQMLFANVHRIPARGTGPKPVIVRLVRWSDRETIINQVFKGVLPKDKGVQTDLPPAMKAERHSLMKEAYKLRTGIEKYRTRILERGTKLRLQIRKSVSQPWSDYKV